MGWAESRLVVGRSKKIVKEALLVRFKSRMAVV
jgi:hypothetical protein